MTPPEFLDVEDVVELHRLELEGFSGADGIRDLAGLESAVGMPRAAFGGEFLHADIFEMAAAYAFHIAQNQPFVNGNKRTGSRVANPTSISGAERIYKGESVSRLVV